MRRAVALLTAVLVALLPAACLAETARTYVLTWEAEEANVRAYLTKAGVEDDTVNVLCAAGMALMDSLSLRVSVTEDARRGLAQCVLRETPILTADWALAEDGSFMLGSSMIPGVVIKMQDLPQELFSEESLRMLLDEDGLLGDDMTGVERGTFVGDAYEDGAYSKKLDFPAEDGLTFDCRLVYDAQGELCGESATVLDGEDQLATLSVGYRDDGVKLVAGFGMAGRTCFCDLVAAEVEDGVHITIGMYRDDAGQGYAAALAQPEVQGSFLVQYAQGVAFRVQGAAWSMRQEMRDIRMDVDLTYDSGVLTDTETVLVGGEKAFGCRIGTIDAPVEWPDHSGDKVYDGTEDASVLQAAVDKGTQALAVDLIKLLPRELLLYLMSW